MTSNASQQLSDPLRLLRMAKTSLQRTLSCGLRFKPQLVTQQNRPRPMSEREKKPVGGSGRKSNGEDICNPRNSQPKKVEMIFI